MRKATMMLITFTIMIVVYLLLGILIHFFPNIATGLIAVALGFQFERLYNYINSEE